MSREVLRRAAEAALHDARRPARRHRRRLRRRARRAPGARRRARRGPGRRPRRRGVAQKPDPHRRGCAPPSRPRRGPRPAPGAPEPPAGDAPLAALATRYRVGQEDLDGWTIAVNLTRSDCRIADAGLRFYAERLAARGRAAARRAPRRPAAVAPRTRCASRCASRGRGELDVEATLDNVARQAVPGAGRLDRAAARRPPAPGGAHGRHLAQHGGENMAIAAVAAAVLALKLHPEDLSVVVFEDKANAVTHLDVPRRRRRRWSGACSTSRCAATPTSRPRWRSAQPSWSAAATRAAAAC